MPDPILIGITGFKGSGKGTVAQFVQQWAAERGVLAIDRGFADKVKLAVTKLLWPEITDINAAVRRMDDLKNRKEGVVVYFDSDTRQTGPLPISAMWRELLQRMGTEIGRDMFGHNFWVDQLLPTAKDEWDSVGDWHMCWWDSFISSRGEYAQICTVSDLRFENEARRIRELGGINIQVDRPGKESDGHASEVRLPSNLIDEVILNSGSLDDLNASVYDFCKHTVRPILTR